MLVVSSTFSKCLIFCSTYEFTVSSQLDCYFYVRLFTCSIMFWTLQVGSTVITVFLRVLRDQVFADSLALFAL